MFKDIKQFIICQTPNVTFVNFKGKFIIKEKCFRTTKEFGNGFFIKMLDGLFLGYNSFVKRHNQYYEINLELSKCLSSFEGIL